MARSVPGVERRQSEVAAQLAIFDEFGDSSAVHMGFAGDGRVVAQCSARPGGDAALKSHVPNSIAYHLSFFRPPHAMDQNDLFEALVKLRILDNAEKGRNGNTSAEQVEPLAGPQSRKQ